MQLIEAFGIPILFSEGYEADDVIGTLAKKAEENGFITYMVTPDKDFGQLVTEKTLIYKPGRMGDRAEIMGIEEVCNKFGIKRTSQVIDMLGLWGDASDNIPGIPGVGEVTARKLLEEFDNIDNLIANTDKISNPKLKEKVKTYADQAIVSRNLATIILDVPIEFHEEKKEYSQLVEEMPSFPGGEAERNKFLADNIVYPQQATENGIQGTVYVSFVVDSKGNVTDVKVLRGIGGGCDEEAVRVVKMMPQWHPGKQNGKNVRVLFNMPIYFKLQG